VVINRANNGVERFDHRSGFTIDRWRMSGVVRAVTAACLFVAALQGHLRCAAADQEIDVQREYKVKGVFLYSFGRYVTWPDSSFEATGGKFVIGVLGDPPIFGTLDQVAKRKRLQDREIVIRRLKTIDDITPCQILFITRFADPAQAAAYLEQTGDQQVLLVGETPGFAERGGAVNFILEGAAIQFELNVAVAKLKQLRMNAKLLSLGKHVGRSTGDE